MFRRGAQAQTPGDEPAARRGVGHRDLGIALDGCGHLLQHAVGGLHRGAFGQGRLEVELTLRDLGDESGLEPPDGGDRKGEDHRRGGDGEPPAAQGGAQHHVVEPGHRTETGFGRTRLGAGAAAVVLSAHGAQHGDEGDGHHERGQEAQGDGDGHVAEEGAGDPLDKDDGQKDRDRGQGRGHHRAADLGGAFDGRRRPAEPLLAFAVDGLEDDDGVVHQHPDPEGQAPQAHDVERDIEPVHGHEGEEHRERDRGGDDHRRPGVAEKDKEHQNRQGAADHRGEADLDQRLLDEPGLVEEHRELVVPRARAWSSPAALRGPNARW